MPEPAQLAHFNQKEQLLCFESLTDNWTPHLREKPGSLLRKPVSTACIQDFGSFFWKGLLKPFFVLPLTWGYFALGDPTVPGAQGSRQHCPQVHQGMQTSQPCKGDGSPGGTKSIFLKFKNTLRSNKVLQYFHSSAPLCLIAVATLRFQILVTT